MKRRDRFTAIVFFLIGGILLLESQKLSLGRLGQPGAGLFPFLLGIAMMVLSSIYFTGTLLKADQSASSWGWNLWRRPLLAIGGVFFYGYLFSFMGFLLITLFFLIYWLWIVEGESWKRIIPISISTTAGLYTVFTLGLKIRLPVGTLFKLLE